MKAEDVKTFGRWVRAIGQDMIDYPNKYKNLEATQSPTMVALYVWVNIPKSGFTTHSANDIMNIGVVPVGQFSMIQRV